MRLNNLKLITSIDQLDTLPEGKLIINTINAHSYNVARKDKVFEEALMKGDVLIPDGGSIVKACQWLGLPNAPIERIAGWDLFVHEMNRMVEIAKKNPGKKPVVMFFGSSPTVLTLIQDRFGKEYPTLQFSAYSPPFVKRFSDEDTDEMVNAINKCNPDLLWIGMTAPKQEKWVYQNNSRLNIHCHVGTIGAVFDFYAGTSPRAPKWMQQHVLEWCFRFCTNPRRLWRRYLIGNAKFICYAIKEMLPF